MVVLASPAEAGRATSPYVKQTTLRYRSTGDDVHKTVTLVNPTSTDVWIRSSPPQYFYGNESAGVSGTCVGSAVPAGSSCTWTVTFDPPLLGWSTTYAGIMQFWFVDSSGTVTVSTDSVELIGKYIAPK